MKILSKEQKEIETLEEWEALFVGENPKKKIQWQDGRSAKTLAEFVLGSKRLENLLDDIFKKLPVTKPQGVAFKEAYPEFEVNFDQFRNGREHDLGVFGQTKNGQSVFVGIEAKVNEEFGVLVKEAYDRGCNTTDRIKGIVKNIFDAQEVEKFLALRYQLLYGLAGTANHLTDVYDKPDVALFLIIAFKTKVSAQNDNYQDYEEMIKALKNSNVPVTEHPAPNSVIKGENIYEIGLKNWGTVYSAYVEIDAENITDNIE